MDESIIEQIALKVNEQVSKTIKEVVESSVKKEIKKFFVENKSKDDVYKVIKKEVQNELDILLDEIQNLKAEIDSADISETKNPGDIFSYAADKLTSIYSQTEDATFFVLDRVENQMDIISDTKENLDNLDRDDFLKILNKMNDNLVEVLTALSFQDIVGQQIKKIVDFIKKVEDVVNRLYLTHNMMIVSQKMNPDLNTEEIKKSVKEKISQKSIDSLLSEYGL